MKYLIFKFGLAIVSLTIISTNVLAQKDFNDCVEKIDSKWGEYCDNFEYYKEGFKRSYDETYQATFQNVCGEKVELKVAMQEKNEVWRTFPIKVLGPEETFTAYACKGSGKYMYWVRRLDDRETLLPSDREIITEYR